MTVAVCAAAVNHKSERCLLFEIIVVVASTLNTLREATTEWFRHKCR
jgi:hypothetical protein